MHVQTKTGLVSSRIDDAVGATCVHGFGGLWGILAVGLFASVDTLENKYCLYDGLFHGKYFGVLQNDVKPPGDDFFYVVPSWEETSFNQVLNSKLISGYSNGKKFGNQMASLFTMVAN